MNFFDFLSGHAGEFLVVFGPLLAIPLLAFVIAAPQRRRVKPAAPEVPAESPQRAAPPVAPEVGASGEIARVVEAEAEAEAEPEPESEFEPESEPEPESESEPESEPEPEIEPELEPEIIPAPEPPRTGLRERLAATRQNFVGRLTGVLRGRTVDSDLLDELEAVLFTADLGVSTAESLMEVVKKQASGGDAEAVQQILRDAVLAKLKRVEPQGDPLALPGGPPHVILVLGVNGSGKTTTIGKLAARYHGAGKHVILGAGDTFRAAASEQLQIWGDRVGCEVIRGKSGGDPAAVAFDTVKAARARGADVAIIDTAGRLQTRVDLMNELGKIARVIGREIPDAPHESLLVLDANTGQNALSQTRLFTEAIRVTALALTKLDGTAKGGVIIGLADEFGIPLRYVGVGEGIEDLEDFEAEPFVAAIFAD